MSANLIKSLFGIKQEIQVEEKSKSSVEIIKKGFVESNRCGPDGCNLIIESMQAGVEANYFWVFNFLKSKNPDFGLGFPEIKKIRDVYTAGEASSLWGSQEQRKGLQQDKVSQYMATIGKMIKDTFQIIRELRIIDERLTYYDGYSSGERDASTALKGTWVDLVEGGTKNPASVFGLASQVGFVTLPDLFFIVNPKSKEGIEKEVNKLKGKGINRKVREVLGRKLYQFMVWKEKTEREIRDRKKFILNYLRMHFNNIKLYIGWVKPYLRSIKQLQAGSSYGNPSVGSTFETSETNLELLAIDNKYTITTDEGYDEDFIFHKYFPCVLVKFVHIAMPQMSYQREFQRGPIHVGRTEIQILPYVLTREQIDSYAAARDKEVFDEVEDLIPSLHESLQAIGTDLDKYLVEAGEIKETEEEKKPKSDSIFKPFISILSGIKHIFSQKEKKPEVSKKKEFIEKGAAAGVASTKAYIVYDVYKKSHGMLAP